MKLLEYLVGSLDSWPIGYQRISQRPDGWLIASAGFGVWYEYGVTELMEDQKTAVVTRAQWEAERERIAREKANEVANTYTEYHAWMDDQKNAARISAEMAWEASKSSGATCGKRSKEDQALWDKVAISQMQALTVDGSYDFVRDYSDMYEESDMRKVIAATACDFADAFMAERSKRMKG